MFDVSQMLLTVSLEERGHFYISLDTINIFHSIFQCNAGIDNENWHAPMSIRINKRLKKKVYYIYFIGVTLSVGNFEVPSITDAKYDIKKSIK